MSNPKLIVSAKERDLIMSWIIGFTPADVSVQKSLDQLFEELKQADIREEKDLPNDVVREDMRPRLTAPSVSTRIVSPRRGAP